MGLYSGVVGQVCKQLKNPGGGGVVVCESPGNPVVDGVGAAVVVVTGGSGFIGPGFIGLESIGPGFTGPV